jgi:hypothetical protein
MQKLGPGCGQPRTPIHMLGIEVPRPQDGKPSAKACRQVRSDFRPGRREVHCQDFKRATSQHNMYGSCVCVKPRNRSDLYPGGRELLFRLLLWAGLFSDRHSLQAETCLSLRDKFLSRDTYRLRAQYTKDSHTLYTETKYSEKSIPYQFITVCYFVAEPCGL